MKDVLVHQKGWSQAQVKFLLENMHLSNKNLSQAMGRSESSIMQKVSKVTPLGDTRTSVRKRILARLESEKQVLEAKGYFTPDVKGIIVDSETMQWQTPIENRLDDSIENMIQKMDKNGEIVKITTSKSSTVPPKIARRVQGKSLTINMDNVRIKIDNETRSINIDFV